MVTYRVTWLLFSMPRRTGSRIASKDDSVPFATMFLAGALPPSHHRRTALIEAKVYRGSRLIALARSVTACSHVTVGVICLSQLLVPVLCDLLRSTRYCSMLHHHSSCLTVMLTGLVGHGVGVVVKSSSS